MRLFLLVTLFLLGSTLTVYAQVGTPIPTGQTVTINAHGECRQVANPSAGTRMVFTGTAPEWASFRNNPNGLTMAACPAGGTWQHHQNYCGAQNYVACPGSPYPLDALGQPCTTSGELCTANMSPPGVCSEFARLVVLFICQ